MTFSINWLVIYLKVKIPKSTPLPLLHASYHVTLESGIDVKPMIEKEIVFVFYFMSKYASHKILRDYFEKSLFYGSSKLTVMEIAKYYESNIYSKVYMLIL